MTDADLLRQFREGKHQQSFSELVARHMPWIYGVARRRTGDEHVAHDVAQAVFVLLAERADQIKDTTRLCAWLMQTAVFASNHTIREENRRRRREKIVATSRSEAQVPQDAASAMSAQIVEIENGLTKLSADDRTLITIRFYQGGTLAQVGAELGISPDAARKRLDRALLRLKQRLQPSEHTARSLGPILAGLASLNRQTVPPSADIANAFQSNPKAVSISKGVSRMLIRSKIKSVGGLVLATIAVTAGVLLACSGNDKARVASKSSSVAGLNTAVDRTNENVQLIVIVSADGRTLTGYSKKTGQWAQVTGENFSIRNSPASEDVGTYRSETAVYAFSPYKNTWSQIAIPKAAGLKDDRTPIVASGVAAIGFKGEVDAYSAIAGTWDTLKIGDNDQPEPQVSPNTVKVVSGDKIYIFTSQTGKWSIGF